MLKLRHFILTNKALKTVFGTKTVLCLLGHKICEKKMALHHKLGVNVKKCLGDEIVVKDRDDGFHTNQKKEWHHLGPFL